MSKFKQIGLQFFYPEMLRKSKSVYNYEGFDLELANKLIRQSLPIVCNDFYPQDDERIIVVSGPIQGGKTTIDRAFGQMHHLASLGSSR
jgi:DNA mismatch repair protein MutS